MTIAVNKIVAQYHAFKISDIEDGTEDGYIADGPHERDADGDGRTSFLEYLHEKYQVVVKEPLSSVEHVFPELSKGQQMEVFFKAVEAGENADLFISLCRTYSDLDLGQKGLPSEGMQDVLLQVVKERPEAEVRQIESLIARGLITSVEELEKWLDFSDQHLSALQPFQRELITSLIYGLSDENYRQLIELKEAMLLRCQNEYQAQYLQHLEPAIIDELSGLLETEAPVLAHIQNAGQAEFFMGIHWLEKRSDILEAIPLADKVTTREAGGIIASLYVGQFSTWENGELLGYLQTLAAELEEQFASAEQPAENTILGEPIYREDDLSPEEKNILGELENALRTSGLEGVLSLVRQHREETLAREIAYSGSDDVLADQLNWNEVFGVLFTKHPMLKEQIVEELTEQLKGTDFENDREAYRQILKSIPCRQVLDELRMAEDLGLDEKLPELWRDARELFGEISQGGDKIDYAQQLRAALAAQNISWDQTFAARPFYVPITFVDLNTMETQTDLGMVIPLPEEGKYILAIRNHSTGLWEGRVLSAEGSTNTLKNFWRKNVFNGDIDSYFLAYFPKIQLDNGSMAVNIEYEAPEGTYEHFCGKLAGLKDEENYQKALGKYQQAFASEEQYFAEQMEEFGEHMPEGLAAKARNEELPAFDDLMGLITKMDSSGAEEQIKQIFNLSDEEFAHYQKEIEDILLEIEGKANRGESYTPLSPAAFLLKAIEKCEGNALKAAALTYSLLFKRSGQCSTGNLTAVYPNAFDWESIDAADKSGAVYHFMGTFFAAYGVQACLVRRYYTETPFRQEVDSRREQLLKVLTTGGELDFNDEEQQTRLLTLTQYLLLSKGDAHQKEVFTLAGIFKEEVAEDQDTSNEVFHDFRGMAAGHAFYQLVWGENFTENGAWFSLNDDRRDAFVGLLANSSNPSEMPLGTMLSAGALLFGLDGLAFSKYI